jgi:hypothetical protein
MRLRGLDKCDSGQGQVTCSGEYVNDISGPIKSGKFLEWLRIYSLLEKDSAVWSYT